MFCATVFAFDTCCPVLRLFPAPIHRFSPGSIERVTTQRLLTRIRQTPLGGVLMREIDRRGGPGLILRVPLPKQLGVDGAYVPLGPLRTTVVNAQSRQSLYGRLFSLGGLTGVKEYSLGAFSSQLMTLSHELFHQLMMRQHLHPGPGSILPRLPRQVLRRTIAEEELCATLAAVTITFQAASSHNMLRNWWLASSWWQFTKNYYKRLQPFTLTNGSSQLLQRLINHATPVWRLDQKVWLGFVPKWIKWHSG